MSRCYYLDHKGSIDLDAVLKIAQKMVQEIINESFTVQLEKYQPSDEEGGCFYIEGQSARGVQFFYEDKNIVVKINALSNYADYILAKIILLMLSIALEEEIIDEEDFHIEADEYFTDENIRDIKYCPDMDLHISCDFNVDPMAWVLAHRTEDKVFYFDEIVMENTTTAKACDEFYRRYPNHKAKVIINGDASGDNRSCTSEYTNYVIIKKRLLKYGYDVDIKIRAFNPPIKNRIAAFNAKVRSADGEVCLYVDKKCEKLLYNIYNLKYREGSSKIDIPTYQQIKQSKELKFLSHPMDAASYLVDYYWPIKL